MTVNVSAELSKLTSWIKAREALEKLATLPLETKRAKVYPRVVELAVEYWTDKKKGGSGLEVENFVNFIVSELSAEPELANQVFTALRKRPIQVRPEHFYRLVGEARDARAVPLMKGLWKTHRFHWAAAALALNSDELADDVAEVLALTPTSNELEVPLAAGTLGGAKALAELKKQSKTDFVSRPDCVAVGLALAGHDDPAYFKKIRRARDGQTAKWLHAALHAPKPKARLAALDSVQKHVEKPKSWVTLAMLLALSRMLSAADEHVVERAAGLLLTHLATLVPNVRGKPAPWHGYFLSNAQAAITRGVPVPTRKKLDEILRSIPHAAAFREP